MRIERLNYRRERLLFLLLLNLKWELKDSLRILYLRQITHYGLNLKWELKVDGNSVRAKVIKFKLNLKWELKDVYVKKYPIH